MSGVSRPGSSIVPTRTKAIFGSPTRIVAPQGDFALRAAHDRLRFPACPCHGHGRRITGQQFDPIGLDERVDREGTARQPLAFGAMAGMDDHRRHIHPVADLAAAAAAFERRVVGHGRSPHFQLITESPARDQEEALNAQADLWRGGQPRRLHRRARRGDRLAAVERRCERDHRRELERRRRPADGAQDL